MSWFWTTLFQALCTATNTALFAADTSRWFSAGAAVFCFVLALHAVAMDASRGA